MLNHEKIRIMTKLAIYEKNKGKEDKNVMEYFKTDYISFKNFKMQMGVTFALIVILGFEFANIVLDNLAKITDFDFVGLGIKYLSIWIVLMVGYTIISIGYNRMEYNRIEKRIQEYDRLLKNLEKIQ